MTDELEIDSLMRIKTGKQYELLYKLKILNREAFLFMRGQGGSYKQKYHKLWTTSYWKEGKQLLREYFTIEGNGVLKCKKCGKVLGNSFTIHHTVYNDLNLMNPLFVEILCSDGTCHKRTYSKRSYKKKK